MTRALVIVVPAAVLLAWWLGVALEGRHGLPLVILLGAVVTGLLWWRQRRRVGRLARDVDAWLGEGPRRPVALGGGAAWRELAVSVNALGASHERHRARRDPTGPWWAHVLASIEGAALVFSAEDRLVAANPAARELLGLPEGDGDLSLVQALGSGTMAAAARESREAGRPVQVDAQRSGRDLRVTSSVIGDEVLVLLTDVTERRRVEELRRDFVVNASHELKTPATAIQTLAEALEVAVATASDRVPALLRRLEEESARLVRMVHDLLDLRRLEDAGPLGVVPVDLAAMIRDVLADHHHEAERRGIELAADLPEAARMVGAVDDLRLIVTNLVANAIHYNVDGGRVEVTLAADGRGAYVLAVTDSGIGIPAHALPRVFERFYRVDTARSREHGGTGLGLAIVRHAAERHGGSVEVSSLLGEGTTFTVTLPIESAA